MTEKIYLKCNAKEKVFNNGSSLISIGINANELTQFIARNTNERGYINLTVQKRREPGQYGDTHMVTLDTWEAKPLQGQ